MVIYVTEGAYAGGRGFPLSQRSFLLQFNDGYEIHTNPLQALIGNELIVLEKLDMCN